VQRTLRDKWRVAIASALLAALALAAYWPVRWNDFVQYDDPDYVAANPHVQQGLTWDGARWAFRTCHAANWHPLTWLAHMVDCQLFGLNPAGHHLSSLFWHVLNTLLLFALLARLTGAPGRSACVAALFAVHPLHVESVAWISERKDLLSTFFGLLALGAYASHVQRCGAPGGQASRPNRRLRTPYLLGLFFFALSLMSKPMLVTLPFLLLLLDYWPLARLAKRHCSGMGELVREKLPFFVLSGVSCALTLAVQEPAMAYHRELPFADRVANALISYVRYLGKAFWPCDLAAPYPYPAHWPELWVSGAAVLLAGITALAFWQKRQRPWLLVGWLWFLGMLIPVIGLVQVGVAAMADRYTYLPLVGIFLAVVWGASEVVRAVLGGAPVGWAVAALVAAACTARTRSQVRVWRTTETLFTHAIAVTRSNWIAHYNLALRALDRYQQGQRTVLLRQLLAVPPTRPEAGNEVSPAHDLLDEVIGHCEAALTIRPAYPDPHVTLAKALTERGRLEAAQAHLETAVRLDSRNAEAHQNLGEILHRQGRAKEALSQYRAALALRPDWAAVLNNAAWLLATDPRADIRAGAEAVRLAHRACELTGGTNLWFLHTLAAAHAEAGDFTNAVQAAEQASQLAQVTGQRELIEQATHRLAHYRSGRPWREGAPSR